MDEGNWVNDTKFDRKALLEDAAIVAESLDEVLKGNMREVSPENELSATLRQLKEETAQFGQRPEVQPLTPDQLGKSGKPVDARVINLLKHFDFYSITFAVNLFPKPGWYFDRLVCQIEFNKGEKPERLPLAYSIFPASEWDTLARVNLHLEAGITENLEFKPKQALPAGTVVQGEAKVDSGLRFVFPARDYAVKKAKIISRGKNDSLVSWFLDDAEYFADDDPLLGVVLQVPKGVRPVLAAGNLVAYRSFNVWGAKLGDLFNYLSEKVLKFFKAGSPLVNSFNWDLGKDMDPVK